jgi:arsenate reductase
MSEKKRVLFLCTHNSARSQMAEGLLRHLAGDRYDVFSAGTEETRVHPLAIVAMREIGVDLTSHSSKTVDRFLPQQFDSVITVCDRAGESCPTFPGNAQRLHWSFEDPSRSGLDAFRKVRDEIEARLREFARPLVCDMSAFTPEQRARHLAATRVLVTKATRTELDDGYAFTIDRNELSPAELGEWVADEWRCCPALDFHVELPAVGPLTLRIAGGANVKPFIAAELALPVAVS